jgi:hypothetical protein
MAAFGATPGALGLLMIGTTQTLLPLPPPWNCGILDFVASAPIALSTPVTITSLVVPPDPGLSATIQFLSAIASGPNIAVQTTNGILVSNDF